MSSFTEPITDLLLSPFGDGKNFVVQKPFEYYVDRNKKLTFKIPKGFVTDFASVPRVFWALLPPWGKYGKAAILHDYLYRNKPLKRSACDRIMFEAMEVLAVPYWQKYLIYYNLKLFGWLGWYKII